MGKEDIYVVFFLNGFSYGSSGGILDQLHMSIGDIYVVFLLNGYSCGFSGDLLDQL